MSHFTVLVIGKDPEKQLAPYHEFECTGEDNEYVIDVDITEDTRKDYEENTSHMLKNEATGELLSSYDDRFYRDPTEEEKKKIGPLAGNGGGQGMSWASKDWQDGKGYRTKVHYLPEDWKEVEIPTKEVKSFLQFALGWHGYEMLAVGEVRGEEHKYGYVQVDKNDNVVAIVRHTNPNRKWDWYQIGGRWNGFFKVRQGVVAALGEPSLLALRDPDYERPGTDRADQCLKADLDIEGMRNEAGQKAAKDYDLFLNVTGKFPKIKTFEQVAVENGFDKDDRKHWDSVREFYQAQAGVQALRENEETKWWWEIEDFLTQTRDEYINKARKSAFSTYAVVIDSQWHEKGKMGWWGISTNEVSEQEWLNQFNAFIDSAPNDTLFTVVDCHI